MKFAVSKIVWFCVVGSLTIVFIKLALGLECFECDNIYGACDDKHPPHVERCDVNNLAGELDSLFCLVSQTVANNGADTFRRSCFYQMDNDTRPNVCTKHIRYEDNVTTCLCKTDKCNWRITEEALKVSVIEERRNVRTCYVCNGPNFTCDENNPPVIQSCNKYQQDECVCAVSRKSGLNKIQRYHTYTEKDDNPLWCKDIFREETNENETTCFCKSDNCNWRSLEESLSISVVYEKKYKYLECYVCLGENYVCDDYNRPFLRQCYYNFYDGFICSTSDEVDKDGRVTTKRWCGWDDSTKDFCNTTIDGNLKTTECACLSDKCNKKSVEEQARVYNARDMETQNRRSFGRRLA